MDQNIRNCKLSNELIFNILPSNTNLNNLKLQFFLRNNYILG